MDKTIINFRYIKRISEATSTKDATFAVKLLRDSCQVLPADALEFNWHVVLFVKTLLLYES